MAVIKNMIYLGDISEETKTVVDPDKSATSVLYARFNEKLIADITSLKVFVNAQQDLNGYYSPWPSGGNWNQLTGDDFEQGGVRKNYPVGSAWDRVKASTGEEDLYFRTKKLVYSIENKPFSIRFNSDEYDLGICLFANEGYLGESTGWINFRSTSPYTYSSSSAGVSEFAIVVKRKDGTPIKEDDYKSTPAVYELTLDSVKDPNKTYYTRSGYGENVTYNIFVGDEFVAGVQYFEEKTPAVNGISLKYRIGGEENICPITGRTNLELYHSDADMDNPAVITDNWNSTVGPVYGGYRSFIDGRLVTNKELFELTASWIDSNQSKWKLIGSGEYTILAISVPYMVNVSTAESFLCSHFPQKHDFGIPDQDFMWRVYSGRDYSIEVWLTKDHRTIDDFKDWFTQQENNNVPVSFVFNKAIRTYSVPQRTIVGYSGINVFWANSGNIKELVYHTTHDEVVRSSLTELYNDRIKEIQMETSVSLIGDELFIDQFTPSVVYEQWDPKVINPYDPDSQTDINKYFESSDGKILCSRKNYNLRETPYGTKITYYSGDKNAGEFFIKNVERVSKNFYKINSMSAVGLMNRQYHAGGIYTGQSFSEVVRDILGETYEYTIDGVVEAERIYGWLPYDTKRNNLHQLLMAYGVNIIKGTNGKMFFTFIEDRPQPPEIPRERIFANGSVTYGDAASRIELTEHAFHHANEVDEETLFDNEQEDLVENTLITFDKPIWTNSIRVDSGSITLHSYGVNHAYISGRGVLKGKPYVHNTRILSEDNDVISDEKVIKVEDATLVTLVNSANVMLRLTQYYFNAITVSQDIEVNQEKTGEQYIMHNAFNEYMSGFITKMSTSVSSFRRAECEIIQNYIPMGLGSSYTHSQEIALDHGAVVEWTIPSEVFEKDKHVIRVVLIGFGDDGYPGEPGEDGKTASLNGVALGGEGGLGGQGGGGGRVLSVTILADELNSLTFKNEGRNSLLVSTKYNYSSVDGSSTPYGYYDIYSGKIFARPGSAGYAGAHGGNGGMMVAHSTPVASTDGEDVEHDGVVYHGAKGSALRTYTGSQLGIHPNNTVHLGGGGGGGASVGSDAPEIPVGWRPGDPDPVGEDKGAYWAAGGNGADGGAGEQSTDAIFGQGGNGGNGGGGGGGAGLTYWYNYVYEHFNVADTGRPGKGGLGGLGSDGTCGGVLVYW